MLAIAVAIVAAALADAQPSGQMTWAVHVSLAPTWFDPAETSHPQIRRQLLDGVGARPAVHGLGLIKNHAHSASYEDLKLKGT